MQIRTLQGARFFTATDGSTLTELFHPLREHALPLRASISYAIVSANGQTIKHRLLTSAEIYLVVSGYADITINDETHTVGPGNSILIPPGAWQSVRAGGSEDFQFYCIVDPAWRVEDEETERLENSIE